MENLTNLSDEILLARIQAGDGDALAALKEKYDRDEILLARIQNGDDIALAILIKKYERLLKAIIYYEIHNAEEEADIYSETVHAIMQRLGRRADDIESAEQWMKQVARSKCQAFLVNAKKRGIIRKYAEEHYIYTAEQDADKRVRQYHLRELVYEIREIVEEKAPICVGALELWEQGLTEAASAAALNIPQNTVKSRRNKIRKLAREHFGVSLPSEK